MSSIASTSTPFNRPPLFPHPRVCDHARSKINWSPVLPLALQVGQMGDTIPPAFSIPQFPPLESYSAGHEILTTAYLRAGIISESQSYLLSMNKQK